MTQPIARTSAQPTAAFQEQVLTLLAPLFLVATRGDVGAARAAVRATLLDYRSRTDDELRLAALGVAFGFGALDALSRAANPDLTLEAVMDLRDNAIALSQAGDRAQAALDRLLRRQPDKAATVRPAGLPASIEVDDLVAFAQHQTSADSAGLKAEPQRDLQTAPGALGSDRTTLH